MEKEKVREFFDRLAPVWDNETVRNDRVISYILDRGGIREGVSVLDVACGTGILFPDYLSRKVSRLTAIDISEEMVKTASAKFPEVRIICGDAEKTVISEKFDCIMVYNAFPHFPSQEGLVRALCGHLKPGGRLTVAHGESRESIGRRHVGRAADVSLDLPEVGDLSVLFSKYLQVDTAVSDSEKYIVSGVLRN